MSMNNIILLFTLLFGFQENDNPLYGIWIMQGDYFVTPRVLIDVKDDSLYLVSIGDLNSGDYSKVIIEGGNYEYIQKESILILDEDTLGINIWTDSLTLQFPNASNVSVFRRLKSELANLAIEPKYILGSFVMRGENYIDSLEFINDSLMIYTGKYHMNSPANKWEIVNYSGYKFLNIHNYISPLAIIKSCLKDEITLDIPYHENYELTLETSKSKLKPAELIGQWIQIFDTTKTPIPAPPGIEDWEPLYKLNIDQDSIHIRRFRKDYKLKWALTNDGKRIYFPDRVLRNNGSWKIIDFHDGILTIWQSQYTGLDEHIIKLSKKYGR
jgi:hypothetical protein